jgi:glycine C-acetyltransferase
MAQRVERTAQEAGLTGKHGMVFWSKDYLGLSHHPAVIQTMNQAALRYGVGSGAARGEAAGTEQFEELERRLAQFREVEAVLTFQTGFMTNIGVFMSIVGKADLVVYDELSHPSIGDAVRLAGAEVQTFPHKNSDELQRILRAARSKGRARRIVIASDTVFGMEGEIAPLTDLVDTAADFEATLVLDDAHGFGVLGRGGRGAIDHFGLHGRVEVEVATLSKALGTMGGFAAGGADLKAQLVKEGRPILYSTSPPAALAAAAIAALDVLEREPERVQRLWANAAHLRKNMKEAGFDTGASETPIVPVLVGNDAQATRMWEELRTVGIETQRVLSHRVTPRLRLIVTSEHTLDQLDHCVQAMKVVGSQIGVL